jgi:hypothetical protein
VVGFTLGGFFTGARVGAAPILHGVAMGLFSIVVWLVANLVGEALDAAAWSEVPPAVFAGGLLAQMIAAAVGARIGSRGRRATLPRQA